MSCLLFTLYSQSYINSRLIQALTRGRSQLNRKFTARDPSLSALRSQHVAATSKRIAPGIRWFIKSMRIIISNYSAILVIDMIRCHADDRLLFSRCMIYKSSASITAIASAVPCPLPPCAALTRPCQTWQMRDTRPPLASHAWHCIPCHQRSQSTKSCRGKASRMRVVLSE